MHHARHSLIVHLGAIAILAGSIFAAPAAMAGGVRGNTAACVRPGRQSVAVQQAQTFSQKHRGLQRSQQIGSAARRHAGVIEPHNTVELSNAGQCNNSEPVVVVRGRSHGRRCR